MNKLSFAKRIQILTALTEGNSLASTSRITGAAKMTVLKLLADAGAACEHFQDIWLRDLPCKRIQVDELWSFVGMKHRNVPIERRREFGVGDVWTFVAIDADTKLVPTWRLGWRDDNTTSEFINDLAERLAGRIQLTSDGLGTYPTAIDVAFNQREQGVDYAQLVKIYSDPTKEDRRRYSPSRFISSEIKKVFGDPDEKHISTSYIERENLNIRTFNRRMTRLTCAFSKKVENHAHQLAINFAHHNFCRIPRTTRATPAMMTGVVNEVWSVGDLVKMVDEYWTNQAWKLAKAS